MSGRSSASCDNGPSRRPRVPKVGQRALNRPTQSTDHDNELPDTRPCTPTIAGRSASTVTGESNLPNSFSGESTIPNTPSLIFSSQSGQSSDASNGPLRKGRTTMKDKEALNILELYSDKFLSPTRSNIAKMSASSDYFRYPWRPHAGEGHHYTGPELVDVKTRCDYELRKHFLVFCSAEALGWIIKTHCPLLDLGSQQFKLIRDYGLNLYRGLKHEFLFERFYGHIHNMMKDYPDEMNQETTSPSFRQWLKDRLDSNVFRYIYGPRTTAVIDYNKTFANKKQLPFWYFQQIFCSFGLQLCDLVRAEIALNPGIEWSPRLPKDVTWKADLYQREMIRDLFETVPLIKKFQHVELEHFTWVSPWATPESQSQTGEPSRRAERERHLSQIAGRGFHFDDSPPPPSPGAHFPESSSLDRVDYHYSSSNGAGATEPQLGKSNGDDTDGEELDYNDPYQDDADDDIDLNRTDDETLDENQDDSELLDEDQADDESINYDHIVEDMPHHDEPQHVTPIQFAHKSQRGVIRDIASSPLGRDLPRTSVRKTSQSQQINPDHRVKKRQTRTFPKHLIDPQLRQTSERQSNRQRRSAEEFNTQ